MNDLRKAAEQTLFRLLGDENHDTQLRAAIALLQTPPQEALRQALAHEALDRMVAENQKLGLYDDGPAVKTYAGGKPNYCTPVDNLDMSEKRVHKTEKSVHEWVGLTRRELDIATLGLEDLGDCYLAIEAKLKEKNT